MTKTVAVFGATGVQGCPVVQEALNRGLIVRAVARDAAKICEMHPGALAFAATLTDEDAIAQALDGVDAAFFHLPIPSGPDDVPAWMGAFMAAAYRVKLPLLVYTTSGPAGDRYPSSVIIDSNTQGMAAMLNSGIPTIVLQPALYLENLQPPVFLPKLRSEGILDYPPFRDTLRTQWTSHLDQARIAAAALVRPDLAGQSFEIGTPDALTGPELAKLLSGWVDHEVTYAPSTPAEFGALIGNAMGNPGVEFALSDNYGSVAQLNGDEMVVDTQALEELFDIKLTSVANHIASWPAP